MEILAILELIINAIVYIAIFGFIFFFMKMFITVVNKSQGKGSGRGKSGNAHLSEETLQEKFLRATKQSGHRMSGGSNLGAMKISRTNHHKSPAHEDVESMLRRQESKRRAFEVD